MNIGEIEKDVPFSNRRGARGKWKDVTEKMEVGDSILITLENGEDTRNVQSSIYGSIARYDHGTFRTKKVGYNLLRLWRTE